MSRLSRRTLVGGGLVLTAAGAAGYGLWPRMGGYLATVEQQRRLALGDARLEDLVRMATLAANGHNTQPWRFRLDGQRVGILPDFSRRTAVVDPDDHHLFISLGCAAENLVTAAAALGRRGEVAFVPGAEAAIDIALSPAPAGRQDRYQAIPLRQSTRSVYDGQPVSAGDLARLEAAAREEGVAVLIFTEPADSDAILDFVVAANSAQMGDPAFVRELADWIRFSSRRAVETGDGLFAACSGNPVLPEWIGRRMFPLVFRKDGENDRYRAQLRSSSGIAVFIGAAADPQHWVRVGRSFQRFALEATALDIRTAHVNQPVEVPEVRAEFARWLGMPQARPDLVVRFGRAPALPMSLRRPVGAVLAA